MRRLITVLLRGDMNMNSTVPAQSMNFMCISIAIAILLPLVLLVYYRFRKHASILSFFVGCLVMLIFAFVLEQIVHSAVFASPAGAKIQANIWMYALYGGLMAGLFEETGRFLAFKTVLKSKRDNNANALMYGAGHGGFEAIVLLGITMINNLTWSILINSGRTDLITDKLSGDALSQAQQAIQALITTPSYQFILGSVERVFAIVLQISFSVLVWFAAKKLSSLILYPAAILLHFIVDAVTAVMSGLGVPAVIIEVVVGVMAVIIAIIAKSVWNKNL